MAGLNRKEIVAGVTTFATMSYIAVINPAILSGEGTGLAFSAVMTATVTVAAVASILMGLYARLPYALAPGMGLNAFVAYTLILGEGLSAPQALGVVVLSGLVFVVLSLTPARVAVARAIPATLRHATACGIGLFLAVIGLRNAGVIVDHPVTLVGPGPLTMEMGVMVAGLIATVLLLRRNVRGALLIGMAAMTVVAVVLGLVELPATIVAPPDFSLLGAFELSGLWSLALIAPVLTLFLTDLLDSLSTFLGVAHASGLVDERGEPKALGRALFVDGVASLLSGLLGTSSATTFIESAAGIREGGRTGATAVVAGLCFLPLLVLGPLLALVPPFATSPTLIIVGYFMLRSIKKIDFDDVAAATPPFLTIVLIPLTFSITQGLVWGVLSYLVIETLCGRARSIPIALWILGVLCATIAAL